MVDEKEREMIERRMCRSANHEPQKYKNEIRIKSPKDEKKGKIKWRNKVTISYLF
jgi:hypothetical protein